LLNDTAAQPAAQNDTAAVSTEILSGIRILGGTGMIQKNWGAKLSSHCSKAALLQSTRHRDTQQEKQDTYAGYKRDLKFMVGQGSSRPPPVVYELSAKSCTYPSPLFDTHAKVNPTTQPLWHRTETGLEERRQQRAALLERKDKEKGKKKDAILPVQVRHTVIFVYAFRMTLNACVYYSPG
jgi:hypothetical protein